MKLSALLAGVPVEEFSADPSVEITDITSDSRLAGEGSLFLCLTGTRRNGHRYIGDAFARGASVAVIETAETAPIEIPFVRVPDTRFAAAHIWNNYYGDPARDMQVVAVTGTNGKTSTAFLLREILKKAGIRTGLIGTVRCLCLDEPIDLLGGGELSDTPAAMTTPDPRYLYGTLAEMRKAGVEIVVLEASSHALALRKLDALRPSIALFTNLSPEHLDYHGTMDAYFQAKHRLFTLSERAVVHVRDEWGESLARTLPANTTVVCSADAEREAEARACDVQPSGVDGVSYVYSGMDAVFRVHLPVPGRYTVENSLLAITAARMLHVDPVTIQEALRAFPGVEGRLERVLLEGAPFSLFLDYAHTPAALESLLRAVRAFRSPGQKITVLFGCGGDRDPLKRPRMGRIASALADFVIITADNSRSERPEDILRNILRGVDKEKPHAVFPDRRDAIRYAIREARPGEILLFVGKGHEKYEITAEGKRPFDEAALARTFWAEIQKDRST